MGYYELKQKDGVEEVFKAKINYWFIRKGFASTSLYKCLVKINHKIYHKDEIEKTVRLGKKNPDKTFYVIRLQLKEGLLSTFSKVLRAMKWAEEQGYIPMIDMVREQMRTDKGAFLNYFVQKSEYSLEEVYQSYNVILSDNNLEKKVQEKTFGGMKPEEITRMYQYIMDRFAFSDEINKYVKEEEKYIDDKTLGVFLRGTDYTAMEPYYHNRQPSTEKVIEQIKLFMNKYSIERIYLVTEDETIYESMKEQFGKQIYCTGDHFIKKYDGKAYIAEYIDDLYGQNVEYITRIILLSKCRWAIGSKANGSIVARWLNNGKYEDQYWFDEGYYGVKETHTPKR